MNQQSMNTQGYEPQTVTVLLSTYNGETYLREQLDSLLAQQAVTLSVLARDDGSTDGTTGILDEYAQRYPHVSWYANGHLGPTRSFLDLLRHAPPTQYYAFCDQDDVWAADKLARAASFLRQADAEKPAIYFSSLELVDANLTRIGEIHVSRAHTFGQTLVRNNAAGCTMMLNHQLREKVDLYMPVQVSVLHDQWTYLICQLFDGQAFVDEEARIQYRQHKANAVGGKHDFRAVLARRLAQYKSHAQPRKWFAEEVYAGYRDMLPEDKRCVLEKVIAYDTSLRNRFRLIGEKEIQYPSAVINIVTYAAILLNVF